VSDFESGHSSQCDTFVTVLLQVESNILKITIPLITNYRLPLGVSETISGTWINTSVLTTNEDVEYRQGELTSGVLA